MHNMNNEDKNSYIGIEEEDINEELEDLKKKETSQMDLVWKRFKRNKTALFGLGVILTLIFVAIFAPFIAPHDPLETDVLNKKEPPSGEHWFGTDQVGRDIFSRLIYGSRTALFISILIVSISGGIGVTLGLIAGTSGGWVDEIIMRLVDSFIAFPVLIFAIAVTAALGYGLYPVIIGVGLVIWTRFARITRGEVLSVKEELYIKSAKAIGENKLSVMSRYVFPNVLPSVIVVATIQMPAALIYSATLNFLGIGVQPPTPSWGMMVFQGSSFMQFYPHMGLFSGAAIVITVLAFNLVGDGLRDALDPVRRGE